jgi:hypothetical protein
MRFTLFTILLVLALNGFSQDINIKGNSYVSLSGGYLDNQCSFDLGYNIYISSSSIIELKARYMLSDVEHTKYQHGFLSFSYAHKAFDIKNKVLCFLKASGNIGFEHMEAKREDKSDRSFPVTGFSIGSYIELPFLENFSMIVGADMNNLWRAEMGEGYYTVRVGINYYL